MPKGIRWRDKKKKKRISVQVIDRNSYSPILHE